MAGLQAITAASILVVLTACSSSSSRGSTADDPAVPVRVLDVSDPQVKDTPLPVSDDEVGRAQAALRDSLAWGAQYYEPRMYAGAQSTLTAALAARDTDPARCRSLLAKTAEAAASAKAAALLAYQRDVENRFRASRAKLVEVGADRAFPDEFARLASGVDATASLFAARSYWNARMQAYTTLRGMNDLYDTVRGLTNWLQDARVRVRAALDAARSLDAPTWAPSQMTSAEQDYQDSLTRMTAGDLRAAVESMKTAGQIAFSLPYLRPGADRQAPSAQMASTPTLPREDDEVAPSNPVRTVPAAETLLPGQRIRIGSLSMSSLGTPQKRYLAYQAAVARFDLVAAEELPDPGVMEKVLAGLSDTWEAAVSTDGHFGFIYSDKIQMVKDLGTYPGAGGLSHSPYAAQFRLVGTRFRVNLVLCRVEAGRGGTAGSAEITRLADIYRYFEKLTGNHGITLLLAGGLAVTDRISESLVLPAEMVSLHTSASSAGASPDQEPRVFASPALRPMIEESGLGASTPPVTSITLGPGK